MENLPFIDDLKKTLSELDSVTEIESSAKLKKEECREKIKKWLQLNNLDEFEIMDADDKKLWRMGVKTLSRKSVNHDRLKEILNEQQYDEIVEQSEYERFDCKPVKSHKKAPSAPKAPKGTT